MNEVGLTFKYCSSDNENYSIVAPGTIAALI
jgi:hypothetical protein